MLQCLGSQCYLTVKLCLRLATILKVGDVTSNKGMKKKKLICIPIEFNFIFRAVCHSTLKCRVCLLKAITLISPASGSQCFNDVLYSLPLLLLMHNEIKTLSILLMYITRWNVNFLQLPGMCSFSSTAVWLPYFA